MRIRKGGRGTSNSNHRGNSRDRVARRRYLLHTYRSDDGIHCRCYRCGALLNLITITVDRIIPAAHGGTYRRNNIRPACAICNSVTLFCITVLLVGLLILSERQ